MKSKLNEIRIKFTCGECGRKQAAIVTHHHFYFDVERGDCFEKRELEVFVVCSDCGFPDDIPIEY